MYKDIEKLRENKRAYYKAHKAELTAYAKAYYKAHKAELTAYAKCNTHGTPEASRKYRESRKAQITEKRIAKRQFLQSLFAGQVCAMCGGGERLVFHHVDPATKCFNVGNADTRSEVAIRAEVAKCIILCRSCHSRLHEPTGLNARFLG
jgi:hypothetical protein